MTTSRKTPLGSEASENIRTGLDLESIKQDIMENLQYVLAKPASMRTLNDQYLAVSYSVRDRMMKYWLNTVERFFSTKTKAVGYFSAEFLLGPQLKRNLLSLGIHETMQRALSELGMDLEAVIEQEPEPGLGNGGLGRLAACFIESLATLGIPSIGFGIRYEHGMFHQTFQDGWQKELTDHWLRLGNPWEIPRPERIYDVFFGGHTERYDDADGRRRVKWVPAKVVRGMAYDIPILGYKVETAGMLRLWKAEAHESFDFQDFNVGDYYGAVEMKITAENITKVLYPNDEQLQGKQLRLEQQFFFVSCSLQNLMEMHLLKEPDLTNFHKTFALQLNDTHPAIAVAELMRLLVDQHRLTWDQAFQITQKTLSYTNHTLLPEALEKWPLPLFSALLPRHMEIIYEINHHFLTGVQRSPLAKKVRIDQLSLIDETDHKYVRMANLACVGCHAVNGVAELHTELLKKHTLKDFYILTPKKFSNKTNGVTQRRWMVLCNPRLTRLISEKIGEGWIKNLDELRNLEKFADDKEFLAKWWLVKQNNKREQAEYVMNKTGVVLNTDSMFDVQVKRIHEYKRQHLKVLHIITLYNRIKNNPGMEVVPRTFIFGGKAAPGYYMAKLIIKLINSLAGLINSDPDVDGRLRVVFIRNFNVKIGHRVYPPADLSEQISTAGMEASGTGNMKFSMNGALTIGTLDGANIEIRDEVGVDNFFHFGLSLQEVEDLRSKGYRPMDYYHNHFELKAAVDLVRSGALTPSRPELFQPLVDALLHEDKYMLMADYPDYIACQEKVDQLWKNQELWTRMSLLNVARMGKFSSDRAIREYCHDIWKIPV